MNTKTSEVQRFFSRMSEMRTAKGLSDYKVHTGLVNESAPEDMAREANAMLNAIEQGEFKSFSFSDTPEMKTA